MKKLLFLLLFCVGFAQAQIVNIPNNNIKNKLLEASPANEIAKDLSGNFYKIDANDDGEIQVSEALQSSYLDVRLYFSTNSPQNFIGIEAFINLEYLDCSQSSLGSLSLNQNINLQYLKCSQTGPGYSTIDLDVSQNINLETLITSNLLTSLDVSHMPNLEELRFSPENQSHLDVSNNLNLRILQCYYGALTSLDVSSNVNLEELNCAQNLLESLNLPQSIYLTEVLCFGNLITEIDVSQNIALTQFAGHNNNFMNLDFSNNENLTTLTLQNNDLNTLVIKNGSNESSLYLSGNPNLLFVCADSDQIASVISQVDSNTVVSSYCTFIPGGNYNTIIGNVLFDFDNNGCDINDLAGQNVRIDIDDGTQQGTTFVNSNGDYTFYTQEGNFILTPSIENSSWFNITPSSATIPFADNNNNTEMQDFCLTANGVHNDVEVLINPLIPAQPGFDAVYEIVYKNKGNQILSGSINFAFDDDILDFISSTIAPDNQTTDNLTWNYTDLLPFETRSFAMVLNVNDPTETPPVNIDEILNFSVEIYPIVDDENPDDNTFILNQTVVGSYDPNDITCLEGDIASPEMIGEYLHYNIRFENTGTAPATFIVVANEIDDTQYDLNTLQILNASHEMTTRIIGNKTEFIFDAINLPPDGRGNVLYKIKTLNTLVVGYAVSQDANIYFDYNFPIETNIATTTFEALSVDEFGQDNSVSVYPNPTNGQLFINSTYTIEGIALYDIQGRQVQGFTISEANTIDITNVSKGIYFLEIATTKEKSTKKIIKD